MITTWIRWSGLLACVGALFQLLVTVPGTLVSYWTTNRGFADDPAQALGIAKWWAPGVAQVLRPLLFFDDPNTVYHMYDGLWMIPFPLLIAGLVGLFHAQRQHGQQIGRLAWAGYLVTSLGLTMLLIGNGSEAWFNNLDWFGITDFVFTFLALPGLLLMLLGATILGSALLRSGGGSRVAAWLLIVGGLPGGALIGLFVVGHLFGFVLFYDLAWIILGAALWTGRGDMSGAAAARRSTAAAQGQEVPL